MKSLTMLILLASTVMLIAGDFKSIAEGAAKHGQVIKQLDEIKLEKVEFKNAELSEAIGQICNGALTKDKDPIINLVIRDIADEEGNEFIVSLNEDETSVAKAIDSLCTQVGYQWSIDVNEVTKTAILVVTPKT